MVLVLGVEEVQVRSVLVWSTYLDEQICRAPDPCIGPGSEQMHRINRVLDMAGRSKMYPKEPKLNKVVNIQILTLTILTFCILGNFSCFFYAP